MTERALRVLIAGGYGVIGAAVARLLDKRQPGVEILIAGRRPEKGEALSRELSRARTLQLDIDSETMPDEVAGVDVIVCALPDARNRLGEYAIRHGIAYLNITAVTGDELFPLQGLALRHAASRPLVPLGYYEAGLLLPMVHRLLPAFDAVHSVQMWGVNDPADVYGEITLEDLAASPGPGVMRRDGRWTRDDASRQVVLEGGETTHAVPFTTLDVSSVAVMTHAPDIRFDVVEATSIGQHELGSASMDMYVEMKGVDPAGKEIVRRLVAWDPLGQAHFTALGIVIAIEAVRDSEKAGFVFPEHIVDLARAWQVMIVEGIRFSGDA